MFGWIDLMIEDFHVHLRKRDEMEKYREKPEITILPPNKSKMKNIVVVLVFLCAPFVMQGQEKIQVKGEANEYLAPLKYRNIGPYRGGRSVSASGVIGDPLTYYMGTTGGGMWKTSDAGQRWENISDGYFTTGSVGAVAVSESDPHVVYVGMGEHAPRGVMTSHGDGESTNAGKTWTKLGLEKTQHIARIVIHPRDPDIVYVAAQGALHKGNKERGIYKSVDGGQTWKQTLFVNDLTGCSELDMDRSNPDVMYAAMWEHQRVPWKVISGGEGSGLYKSIDGGESWFKIHKGLPDEKGKMAISVSRANPDKVYALIESDSNQEKGGLFVSNNAGANWTRVSDDHRLIQRAWYYIEVFADPENENTVYVLSAPALRSEDGGKTWERIHGTHGDFHDLWINPNDANNLCIANDGGAAISFNQGQTWSTQSNMPTSQFYRVNVDNQFPYRIYGGQQDNSSISIAHRELGRWSISPKSWEASAGGESAFLAFDPDNPRYVMGGSYLGTIDVLDTEAKASTNIMSAPIQYLGMEAREMKYLYNWNAPIIWSQHEDNTFYHGAQYLLRTKDMGQNWEEISPDLTRNIDAKQGNGGGPYTNEAVGAENYGTISYVIESPHEKGVIWTGSDDGYVQLTRDGGENWTNVTPKGLEECLINAIDVSPHDPGTAYIATTRYKFDDKRPGLYKTTNYGSTWTSINSGIPDGAFTRVVREDEKRKDMLIAGTEAGMYISWSGGSTWEPLQLNLPVTPILDLQIKHDDVIVGTSGRSFWILDDVGMLRQYDENRSDLKLYQPENAYLVGGGSQLNGNGSDGTHPFEGVNPATGVVFYYNLGATPSDPITLEIKNADGELINRYSSEDQSFSTWDGGPRNEPRLDANFKLNRFVWNMRHESMPGVPGVYIEGGWRGHKASPGKYTAILTADGETSTTEFEILANPLYPKDIDYEGYDAWMSETENTMRSIHEMVNDLYRKNNKISELVKELGDDSKHTELVKKAGEVEASLKAWDDKMVQRLSKAYDDVENYPNKFSANYLYLINASESEIPRINQGSRDRKLELDKEWSVLKAEGQQLMDVALPALNRMFWEAGIGALR